MRRRLSWGLAVFFLWGMVVPPQSVRGWSTHVYLTYPVFDAQPVSLEWVAAEPLENFLSQQKDRINQLIQAEELWAKEQVKGYRTGPKDWDLTSVGEDQLKAKFLKALRLNPDLKLPLYLMVLPGRPVPEKKPLPWAAVSVLPHDFQKRIYVPLEPGEKIKALDVLASASDEPDNGLDIGLWEDNDTPFGKRYGYGKQPFGNPRLDYGTQAPFHMGFFHESEIVYKAAPSFRVSYVEQRIHLFRSLARLAFETGHPYWGYRFAGWGLHYLQDMTMPYHTTIMPGRSTVYMLWVALLDLIGVHGPKDRAVSEVSRGHILVEKLLNQDLQEAHQRQEKDHVFFRALRDTQTDGSYPGYEDRFPSQVAAKESRRQAKALAQAIRAIVTDKESYRDIERISNEGDYDARKFIQGADPEALRHYNGLIEGQLRSLGAFSRLYWQTLISRQPSP